jgi:predicted nucleotide-binding protein
MARKKDKGKERSKPEKPELFVGSSGEAARLTGTIVQLLRHEFKVTPWTAGVFEPSSNPLADLVRQLEKSAYGIFIFAKDDRVTSRGKQYESTRDNVLFELGLFMGKLGPANCFILVPRDRKKLKIPSDLEGFSLVPYEEDRLADNPQAAFAGACTDITSAITRRRKEATAPDAALSLKPKPPAPAPDASVQSHMQDLLGMVHVGSAGLDVILRDSAKFRIWAKNVLHMALLAEKAVTPALPSDAYIAWLRPTAEDPERLVFFLGENTSQDFATVHHPFSLGEGLAGSVWADGEGAIPTFPEESLAFQAFREEPVPNSAG